MTLLEPTEERQFSWPGNIATSTVYASSDDSVQHAAWRFGELSITHSGSMPQLTGFQRLIALIEGEGVLVMHADNNRTEALAPGEYGCMDLGDANEVELIEGPVRLLDLVLDSSQYQATANVLGDEENMLSIDAEMVLLYGLDGERMHCILEEHEFALQSHQWARIDHPPKADLQCTEGRALIVTVHAV